MADMKTSAEAAAAALDGTELVRIVQAGNSRQTTTEAIAGLALGAAFSRLTAAASTSLPNNTITEVAFATEATAGGFRGAGTPTNGFIIPVSGVTHVRFSWVTTISSINAQGAAGFRVLDGAANPKVLQQPILPGGSGSSYWAASIGPIPVSGGDTFTLHGFQNGGGTEDMNLGYGAGASDLAKCFFAIEDATP